jgi:hypothetical protein
MSDPSKPAFHEIPAPPSNFARENTIAPNGRRSIATIAKRWLPQNVSLETLIATVSRYANRLIDRTTGIPYSADELETKILAGIVVPSHTHVSADVTDSTVNGASNVGKLLKTETIGVNRTRVTLGVARLIDGLGYQTDCTAAGLTVTVAGSPWMVAAYPNANGYFAVLPGYADSTAANAVVSIGDVLWDTTLNNARVRLS